MVWESLRVWRLPVLPHPLTRLRAAPRHNCPPAHPCPPPPFPRRSVRFALLPEEEQQALLGSLAGPHGGAPLDCVQLRSRHWIVRDGRGAVEGEVRGEAVVGHYPLLRPGGCLCFNALALQAGGGGMELPSGLWRAGCLRTGGGAHDLRTRLAVSPARQSAAGVVCAPFPPTPHSAATCPPSLTAPSPTYTLSLYPHSPLNRCPRLCLSELHAPAGARGQHGGQLRIRGGHPAAAAPRVQRRVRALPPRRA